MVLKTLKNDKQANKLHWIVLLASTKTLSLARKHPRIVFYFYKNNLFASKTNMKAAEKYLDTYDVAMHKDKRYKW